MRLFGRSLLLGMSAATFFMAPVVEQLLRLTPARLYFVRIAPDRLDYKVLLGLIFVLGGMAGAALWMSYWVTGAFRRILEGPLVMLGTVGIGHSVYLHLSRYPPLYNVVATACIRLGLSANEGWFGIAVLCGLGVTACFAKWPKSWTLARPLLYGGAAVIWLTAVNAWWHPAGPLPEDGRAAQPRLRTTGQVGPGNPVVWVILDEWDYDLTYRRDDHKVFPELERLRQQSMFLDNVRAAGKITLVAIPSLLMGQPVREYRASNPAGARFVSLGVTESFPGPRTIFDAAIGYGYQTHIVGWYHPYCRIFGAQATTCWWDDLMVASLRPGAPAEERAAAFLRDSIELESFPLSGPSSNVLKQLRRIGPMMEQSERAAANSGRSFSFLHLPVPHAPFFKQDAEGKLEPVHSDTDGYRAGLEAADRAVGVIRAAMEHSGVWDEALVIVSSDHPYRHQFIGGYGNGHIPMMIKFPKQTAPLIYSHPFQAVGTKELIEDFMQGSLATPERAIAWLDRALPASDARPPSEGVRPVSMPVR